ncbi:MAG: diphosphomevalonate decarboxylase [Anaerolineales bacterium]
MYSATALAHPNIAFIKYWGNRNAVLRLPVNDSLSMNLGALVTRTTVTFSADALADSLCINGSVVRGTALQRVSALLDRVRALAGLHLSAQVESENNFPTGAGIASSAAAFAALAQAASAAAGLHLDEQALSRLARTGSGSAARSIPPGFVLWHTGSGDEDSFAESIAPPEYWPLDDCIAVVSEAHKPTGSTQGHALAETSPLQSARVADAPRRVEMCRQAILQRDFDAFAAVTELDCNLMHAVMMTSTPPLFYWQPATLAVMQAVQTWRAAGWPVCYTIDAGPNVHVLCPPDQTTRVQALLADIPGVVATLVSPPGGAARLL